LLIKKITIDIVGIGLVIYCESQRPIIAKGADFLATSFMTESQVYDLMAAGKIMGLSTGTPGTFCINCYFSEIDVLTKAEFNARGYVLVSDGAVRIRDLYDLMDWSNLVDESQIINLPNGHYCIVASSQTPVSGILGDDQEISITFVLCGEPVFMENRGIPTLC